MRCEHILAGCLSTLFPIAGCGGLLPPRSDLTRYKQQHYAAIPRSLAGTADWQDFRRRIARLRLLALGDVHSDRRLHRRLLRILRAALRARPRAVLLVEFLGWQDQPGVDAFLHHRRHLADLRRSIQSRWPESWLEQHRFDGRFYRDVLETARGSGATVHGIEPIPRRPLIERDALIAQTVADAISDNPGSLVVLLVGHTHLLGNGHVLARLPRHSIRTLLVLPRVAPSGPDPRGSPPTSKLPFDRLRDDVWVVANLRADAGELDARRASTAPPGAREGGG